MNKMEDVIKIYHASNDVDAEIILERLRDCGIEGYISEAHSVYPKIYSGSMNGSVIWGSDIYINAQDEEQRVSSYRNHTERKSVYNAEDNK